MFISLKRIIKFAWQGFWRNKGLSFQVIFILTIAVFIWTSLFFCRTVGIYLIENLEKKIDIAVYFKKDIEEQEIFEVRDELFKLSYQIKTVDYISRNEAMENFTERHQNDPLYLSALEEVEDNPFLASLNIKARQPDQYAAISDFLKNDAFEGLIEKVSYNQNKEVIDKVFSLVKNVRTIGIIIGLTLSILVILVTFNTVKLGIVSSKEEITTMRFVGASNWFIRGPFVVQGIICSLFAVVIVNLLFIVGFIFFNHQLAIWFLGLDFFSYFRDNYLLIVLIQIFSVGLLGIVSSALAVRKYLKV